MVKNTPANAGDIRDMASFSWVRKIPWRRAWQPTPVSMPGKSHGQRSLVGYSPWGRKESDMTKATFHCTHTGNWRESVMGGEKGKYKDENKVPLDAAV